MKTLYEALSEYGKSSAYPFHMPGHKRQVENFGDPFAIDITEIDGFDNLHHAEGILKEAEERASAVYKAEETHFLVNGSTAGILSAISALVRPGGEILMARNCHKAAYHACYLGGVIIHYLYPQWEPECGINGGILPKDVDNFLEKNPKIQAVMITSPTYDGAVSDVEAIAEAAHAHGIPLIVDEAHGAHFGFHPYFPESALKKGADVVIHSLHKTLPSLTQTALIHVNGILADRDRLRRYLGIYQSSSPSYVFMASMDRCVDFLRKDGKKSFDEFSERLQDFYEFAGDLRTIRIPGYEIRGKYGIFDFDRSKILLCPTDGHGGEWIYQKLRREYGLQLEMAAGGYALALTSVMDTEEGFDRLKKALAEIDEKCLAEEIRQNRKCEEAAGQSRDFRAEKRDVSRDSKDAAAQYDAVTRNEVVLSVRDAFDGEKETIPLSESEGRVAGEFLYLYPPGIPILVPGERISEEVLNRVAYYKKEGLSLQGIRDYEAEKIEVLKD